MEKLKLLYTEERLIQGTTYRMEILQLFAGLVRGTKRCKVYELVRGAWILKDEFQAEDSGGEGLTAKTFEEIAEGSWPLFKIK